jgi:benzoylformate decarboxylase
LGIANAPGLDLPDLDAVRIARAYGVPAQAVTTGKELTAALRDATKADGPRLVEVPIGPQCMPLA